MRSRQKTSQTWKSLGIPEEYHIKLQQLAKMNHRTISGQMAAMIDAALQTNAGQRIPAPQRTPAEGKA